MSVYRHCYLFRCDSDKDMFYVERLPRRDGEPQVDLVRYADCYFTHKGNKEVTKIVDHVHGNTYYTAPDCRVFQ